MHAHSAQMFKRTNAHTHTSRDLYMRTNKRGQIRAVNKGSMHLIARPGDRTLADVAFLFRSR